MTIAKPRDIVKMMKDGGGEITRLEALPRSPTCYSGSTSPQKLLKQLPPMATSVLQGFCCHLRNKASPPPERFAMYQANKIYPCRGVHRGRRDQMNLPCINRKPPSGSSPRLLPGASTSNLNVQPPGQRCPANRPCRYRYGRYPQLQFVICQFTGGS